MSHNEAERKNKIGKMYQSDDIDSMLTFQWVLIEGHL